MNPYSQTLAQARLDALKALQQALQDAETPDEKRRCAVAIFNAPDPCDLDDTIDWDDVEDNENDADTESDAQDQDTLNDAGNQTRATGSPALRGQPVHACNRDITSPETAPARTSLNAAAPAPHPNSFPDHPELAPFTDEQILHATPEEFLQLAINAHFPNPPSQPRHEAPTS